MPMSTTTHLRRWLFVIPLFVLIWERLVVTIQKLDESLVTWPKDNLPSEHSSFADHETPSRTQQRFPPLDDLTSTITRTSSSAQTNRNSSCPGSMVWMSNRISSDSTDSAALYQIPRYIHQTSKSRCLTPGLANLTARWHPFIEDGWSYYFHDDEAVDKLLSLDFPEFPLLKPVATHCLRGMTGTVRADLWRYVILWVYGGLYADLDTTPNYHHFNVSTITPDMQGYFVREYYHLVSQYFMVMAPRHPLMYYAIHESLSNLYAVANHLIQERRAPFLTGPHALHRAFQEYRMDVGVEVGHAKTKPVTNGTFLGTDNTTIVVVGLGGNVSDEHIRRSSMDKFTKGLEYDTMGMRHFSATGYDKNETKWGRSCIHFLRKGHH